jgi:hypothetical protein
MTGRRQQLIQAASAATRSNFTEKCGNFRHNCGSTAGRRVVQLRKAVMGTVAFGRSQGGSTGWIAAVLRLLAVCQGVSFAGVLNYPFGALPPNSFSRMTCTRPRKRPGSLIEDLPWTFSLA